MKLVAEMKIIMVIPIELNALQSRISIRDSLVSMMTLGVCITLNKHAARHQILPGIATRRSSSC